MKLSIVIPLYNEEKILWEMINKITDGCDKIIGKGNWQLVLVNNGSSDNTQKIIDEISRHWKNTLTIFVKKPNYGKALRAGIQASDTNFIHIINIEQWDMTLLAWSWDNKENYDLILGSKRADPTTNHQSFYRRILSWGLNSLLDLLFEYPGADSHGPKIFNRRAMENVLNSCVMDRGQYDTELTIRALREGLTLAECPSEYIEYRKPRNMLFKKVCWNIIAIVRMWMILRKVEYKSYVRLYRFTRYDLIKSSRKYSVGMQKSIF